MIAKDNSLAEKATEAFRALSAEQRGHIFRRVASREHKIHYFGTLFEKLHIAGFSRPHLANSWLGKFPQQRIEAHLQNSEGEERFTVLLFEFFMKSHRQLNDRFLELFNADVEGRCRAAGERCLTEVAEEFKSDPYRPLYDAAIRWLIIPSLPDKAEAKSHEESEVPYAIDGIKQIETEVCRNQLETKLPTRVKQASEAVIPDRQQQVEYEQAANHEKKMHSGEQKVFELSVVDSLKLDQVLNDIEALSKRAVELRVAELTIVSKRLQAALNPLPDLESRVTGLSERLGKKIAELNKIAWLAGCNISEPVGLQPHARVKDEIDRLQQLDAKLAQILQFSEQIATLTSRIVA